MNFESWDQLSSSSEGVRKGLFGVFIFPIYSLFTSHSELLRVSQPSNRIFGNIFEGG